MKFGIAFITLTLRIGAIDALLAPRIVGGENADIERFPYQASLRLRGGFLCGGSIIGPRHVLTTAHCITRVEEFVSPYREVSVSTGTGSSKALGQSHRIVDVMIHPGFVGIKESSFDNDIAVITLQNKIKFNRQQQMIKMSSHPVVGAVMGILTGWGHTTAKNGEFAEQLQKLTMRILKSTECQPYHRIKINKKQLCAFHGIGHGSCFGDSGGPLVVANELIGVLSCVGDKGCATGQAEIFSSVYDHREFIESAMIT